MLKCRLLAALLFVIIFKITTSFADQVNVSRYLAVDVKPQQSQTRLLQQQLQIKFPQDILTLKQAVEYVLQFSGYRLAESSHMSKATQTMLAQALPEVDSTFEPMTLEQALTTLAGESFYVLLDPVNRLVSFVLKPNYQPLYQQSPAVKSDNV
ncbi:MAG: hypothetical protein K5Q00_07500 [Gammaproteobacteria bacterium]|nr:hypothetical protein [Gammaproteobacteria bacterium]